MTELRIDPLTGQQVLIAADRSLRPQEYVTHGQFQEDRSKPCPFCRANEQLTPSTLAEICDAQGEWQVRVVPNKFPAVVGELGTHEVIIESPEHVSEAAELDLKQWVSILRMQRDRLKQRLASRSIEAVAIYKNSGPAAGASMAHVHSQLTATSFIPQAFAREYEGALSYWTNNQVCYFCREVEVSEASHERLIHASEHFSTLCPIAPRQSYESWIVPKSHNARFELVTNGNLEELAAGILLLLKALQRLVPQVAYNLMLHTSPAITSYDSAYHWHWRLLPRLSRFAGIELGSGVMINSVAPEVAAERLRDSLQRI